MKTIREFLPFNSLKFRITLVFLVLILVIQATGYLSTRYNVEKNVRTNSLNELAVGEHVLNGLLSQNSTSLTLAAKVLATDYGFRAAIASNDIETIVSALNNYRTRIGADIAIFNDNSGNYVTGTAGMAGFESDNDINQLIKYAMRQGHASGVVVLNHVPYQLVVLPVKAPLDVGLVTMGFAIDNVLATRLHDLSGLQVTFLSKTKDSNWLPTATTLDKASATKLATSIQNITLSQSTDAEISLNNTLYSTRYVNLNTGDTSNKIVVVA